jgi:hypothetical protein
MLSDLLQRHIAGAMVAGVLSCASLAGAADTWQNWATMWTADGKFYTLNNGYSLPAGAAIQTWLYNQNSWGGQLYFNGTSGGAAAQINYGKWPWSSNNTTGSGLPVSISTSTKLASAWDFSLYNIQDKAWNAFWELWTHRDASCTGTNITCDLMIHPQYDSPAGTYQYSRTFDGVSYGVYLQPSDASRPYPIVHYYRSQKTQSITRIRFDLFFKDLTASRWANSADYLGSITAGIEAAWGSAALTTTKYNVWRTN